MTGPALRIAMIASSQFPVRQPFAGGLESHVWHLARALTSRGYEVTLFAAPGSDPALRSEPTITMRAFDPSPAARRDSSMAPDWFLADHHAYLSVMLELAEAGSDRFDVVHNHSLHYLPVAMAPSLNTPMLCTLHTPPTPWLESAVTISRGAGARFVAVSAHTARSWSHAIDTNIEIVPNGVDLDEWPLGEGGDRAIWFGRLTPEKGPHHAIAAALRAHRNLWLAGPISDAQYFREHISPQLDTEQVVYLGHLSQPELAAAVGASAVTLVTPEWDEPYGLVVAESLACGTPVIAFNRGGIAETINSPAAGRLVPPGDVGAMARAITEVAQTSRTAARAHARARCSEATMVGAYLKLYQSMAESHRRGGLSTAVPTP